jgi:hypothetical protein
MDFKAIIEIIGINPFVFLPDTVLHAIFHQACRKSSPIPVTLQIRNQSFSQNLVRYKGTWRLYINTPMLKVAGKKVGDEIQISIAFDAAERITVMHPKLAKALCANENANKVFLAQPPSLQKEIKRYINHLKTEESIDRNVQKAILFLTGKERFIGRDGLG